MSVPNINFNTFVYPFSDLINSGSFGGTTDIFKTDFDWAAHPTFSYLVNTSHYTNTFDLFHYTDTHKHTLKGDYVSTKTDFKIFDSNKVIWEGTGFSTHIDSVITASPVPESSAIIMLAVGLVTVGLYSQWKRRR